MTLDELMSDFVRLNDLIAHSIASNKLGEIERGVAFMEAALYKNHEIMRKIHKLNKHEDNQH